MLQFIEPWEEVVAAKQRIALEAELQQEVIEHNTVLFAQARILARQLDRDDFLFEIKNARWRYAIVHLTSSGRPEILPWSLTKLYLAEDDVAEVLKQDAAEYS